MSSGQTHDRITLWSLPWVTGIAFGLTLSANLTLLISGGFLFGGLMFGPDLDIYSRQYQRWGLLRWIWLPYQKGLRHRSLFSHGPLVGTALRILYLACWASLFLLLAMASCSVLWGVQWDVEAIAQRGKGAIVSYQVECFALFVGLELGAMSHSLSDCISSAYKHFKRKKYKSQRLNSRKTRK